MRWWGAQNVLKTLRGTSVPSAVPSLSEGEHPLAVRMLSGCQQAVNKLSREKRFFAQTHFLESTNQNINVIVIPGLIEHQYAKFAPRYGILVDSVILIDTNSVTSDNLDSTVDCHSRGADGRSRMQIRDRLHLVS